MDISEPTLIALLIIVVLAILVLLAGSTILAAAVLFVRRYRSEKERDKAWADMQTIIPKLDSPMPDEHRLANWMPDPSAFGKLTVQNSDDRTLIGSHFDLIRQITTLGRAKDNDIKFPKDGPVSRHHARIEKKEDRVFLIEEVSKDDSDHYNRPKFGTFVNQVRLQSDPFLLKSGSVIQLGKRLQLKFDSLEGVSSNAEKTYVAFSSQNAEQTVVSPVTKDTEP